MVYENCKTHQHCPIHLSQMLAVPTTLYCGGCGCYDLDSVSKSNQAMWITITIMKHMLPYYSALHVSKNDDEIYNK